MNEDFKREFRAIQSAHLSLAGAHGRLADLFPVDTPGPEPPGPPPGHTWEAEHTMTAGDTSRTFIIAKDLGEISRVRMTLWVTPTRPAPNHGGELAVLAPFVGAGTIFRDGVLEDRYLDGGRGLKLISGPGLERGDKLRFEVPGQLRIGVENLVVAEVDLGATPRWLTYEYGIRVGARNLPEAALKSVRGPLALHVGGPEADLWEGLRIKARVEVL